MGSDLQIRDPQSYAVIGAAMAVHRKLGHAFLEAVYHEAMGIEFDEKRISHQSEVGLPVTYKGRVLKCRYKADFVCFGDLVVEIKALGHEMTGTERAQVINYLKATGFKRALVINFGKASLKFERIVLGAEDFEVEV